MEDPIVEEVRRAREAYLRQFNYDLEAIFRDLKAREKEHTEKGTHKIVSLAPKRIEPAAK
jgi:hypothetical protein